MSIEQTNDFHIVKRMVRTISPEYRVLASPRIPAGSCVMDAIQKTIELGESQDIPEAIAVLLFQVGHLRMSKDPRYAMFYGSGKPGKRIRDWKGTPEALIKKLATMGIKTDRAAAAWAAVTFSAYWPHLPDIYDDLASRYCWDRHQWRKYFAEQ